MNEFKTSGLKPFFGESWFQVIKFPGDGSIADSSKNVAAWLDRQSDTTFVIGAHYDHIGMGGKLSRSYGIHGFHPGADDNASGVAVMLQTAKMLSDDSTIRYNVVFVAFTAHENGLYGSEKFAADLLKNLSRADTLKKKQSVFMINLDMTGRMDTNTRTIFFSSSDAWLKDVFTFSCTNYTVNPSALQSVSGDHSAFHEPGMASLYITTGMHDDYHKTSDVPEKLNYKGMTVLTKILAGMIKKRGS